METVLHFRVSKEQEARLKRIQEETGWTASQIMRHLLDNATIKPAIIRTEIKATNGNESDE